MKLARGELFADVYLLLQPLAAGGMGSVWLAERQPQGLQVAIKFNLPRQGSSEVPASVAFERFRRECEITARINSPHVVRILDYGNHERTPFLVLEYLAGEDLETRLRRCQKLSVLEAERVLVQAAAGLAEAHRSGVVHRDLKPSNLFLVQAAGHELLKILDFGIAKISEPGDALTADGVIVGSPEYMSPEQARGGLIDHRSDLWSLGVVLYRALTGHLPFTSNAALESLESQRAPLPSVYDQSLPAATDRFFERAFARFPERRFQSAQQMAAAFSALIEASRQGEGSEPPLAPSSRKDGEKTASISPTFSTLPFEHHQLASASLHQGRAEATLPLAKTSASLEGQPNPQLHLDPERDTGLAADTGGENAALSRERERERDQDHERDQDQDHEREHNPRHRSKYAAWGVATLLLGGLWCFKDDLQERLRGASDNASPLQVSPEPLPERRAAAQSKDAGLVHGSVNVNQAPKHEGPARPKRGRLEDREGVHPQLPKQARNPNAPALVATTLPLASTLALAERAAVVRHPLDAGAKPLDAGMLDAGILEPPDAQLAARNDLAPDAGADAATPPVVDVGY